MKEIIAEILGKYIEYRERWIKENGSDKGFDTWFTKQVVRGEQ